MLLRPSLPVGLFSLALTVQAFATLLDPPPPQTTAPSPTKQAPPAARPRGWRVVVDGWVLGFDATAPGSPVPESPITTRGEHDETSRTGRSYEPLIRKYAAAEGIDWRLVMAVAFAESGFQPDAESEAGAYGLMQIREIAARDVDATEFHDTDDNLRTGIRYLAKLRAMFPGLGERDHWALVLAAYNMGPSHVRDAQQLARRFGFEPLRWDDSIERVLPLLEQPAVYSLVESGFADGSSTVEYVNRVLDRYAQMRAARR